MGAISAEDIISIIQSEIENFDVDNTSEETGTVIYVGDGIVTVYGIDHAMYGEVVVFDNGVKGMVQDIRQNEIGVILFGRDTGIKEGTKVVRTKKKAGIPVGNEYIGRVINALGEPIDGGAEIKADGYRPIEEEAPGIIERKSVDTPMETGILSIDSMFPIGRGQRELIIGDRQTGKTSIATDAILNLVSREILTGLSVIRAFGREKTEEERFDEANKKLTGTQLFTNRIMTFMMPGMMFIMYSVTILITWVSAQKIDAGTLQVGAMTAFITYAMQIVMAFLMMTAMSIMVPRAGVAADRIDEVLKTEASVQNVKKPETLKEHKGVLEFSHVDFKYPGAEHNVLSDIDFKVEPGKTTAIIGSTGCGKSTLVNLIPRFYDVTGGQITLDGKDIRRISMEELREEIGFVPQKGVLFSGTIASNLRFGKADATDEDIKEAAEIAQATEFIETKKEKYDSPIAQGGSNVSGGQKQRLAIARAIAKKAKVLVFDDSFSALDMKTDAALRKELNEKVQDASIVIVAQRVSTILHADQILVLDDGKIVGKGTHEELLKNCEVYLQIAKSQLSEKELGLEKLGLAEEKAEKETNKKEILSTKIDEKENNKLKEKSDDKKLKHKKGGK